MTEKLQYYQLAIKGDDVRRIVSPSSVGIDGLLASGYSVFGYDSELDMPMHPILDGDAVREKTPEELEQDAKDAKRSRTIFSQLQIRGGFKALGIESTLNALISGDPEFDTHWHEADYIDLNHPVTADALKEFSAEQIEAIILAIE